MGRTTAAAAPDQTRHTRPHWLGWASLAALVLFVLDTALVMSGSLLHGFDEPLAQTVQSISWGPLTHLMELTNTAAGLGQDLFGLAVVVALFWYDQRAGARMALGAIGSLLDQIVKLLVARPRPTQDVVQILNPTGGFSFPSGHAVFITWIYFMLAMTLLPKLAPRLRPTMGALAGSLILLACIGRVWAGVHWPTDVIGGFLLAIGWCSFVLWLPERFLSVPRANVPTVSVDSA